VSNPLESGTYRLKVWEVGGSSEEATDTGMTGTLAEMSQVGLDLTNGKPPEIELPDGRTLVREDLAGYVVQPEATDA
jgi:hypothetical protein